MYVVIVEDSLISRLSFDNMLQLKRIVKRHSITECTKKLQILEGLINYDKVNR